jgi:hypothetical protein
MQKPISRDDLERQLMIWRSEDIEFSQEEIDLLWQLVIGKIKLEQYDLLAEELQSKRPVP